MASATIKCANCGAAGKVGENFCGECGTRMPEAEAPVEAPVEAPTEAPVEAPAEPSPAETAEPAKKRAWWKKFGRRKTSAGGAPNLKPAKKAKKSSIPKTVKRDKPAKAAKAAKPAKPAKPTRNVGKTSRPGSGPRLFLWPSSVLSVAIFYLLVVVAIGAHLFARYPDYVLDTPGRALQDIAGESVVVLVLTLGFVFIRRLIFKPTDPPES